MFEAKVYTTAILSLSGMMDETHTARETVSRLPRARAEPLPLPGVPRHRPAPSAGGGGHRGTHYSLTLHTAHDP